MTLLTTSDLPQKMLVRRPSRIDENRYAMGGRGMVVAGSGPVARWPKRKGLSRQELFDQKHGGGGPGTSRSSKRAERRVQNLQNLAFFLAFTYEPACLTL